MSPSGLLKSVLDGFAERPYASGNLLADSRSGAARLPFPMATSTLPGFASGLWRAASGRTPAPSSYRLLFNPFATWGSLAMLALCAALPPDGAGIPVCLFRAMTGLPCPGCGLTRALSSLIQGHAGAAFSYHPFAFVFLPLFATLAAFNFLPQASRRRGEALCAAHDRGIRQLYYGFIYSLVGFGVLRMLEQAAAIGLKN